MCKTVYFLFIPFFLIFFTLNSKCTSTFTYIVFLNYLDTNTILFLLFTSILYPIHNKFGFFFTQVFFILPSFYQLPFFRSLIPQLVVGTVLIHPVMFYFFLLLVLGKCYLRQHIVALYQLSLTFSSIFFFLCTTLVLGGFWATQSNSWGYFWVNDLVEWSLLFIILLVVFYLHTWSLVYICYNVFFFSFLMLTLILAIRFGVFSTRHNFINTDFLIYNIYYFYFHLFFIFTKLRKSLHQVKFTWVFFIFFFLGLGGVTSFFFKTTFFVYFLFYWRYFTFLRKFIYFHFLLFTWVCLWSNPFVFFFMVHKFNFTDNIDYGILFSNFFSFTTFYYNFSESLAFITFLFNFFKYYIITLFKINGLILMNNFQLLYLLCIIIIFFRKMGWI